MYIAHLFLLLQVPLVRDPMHQFMLCVLCETKYMLGHSARQNDLKRGRLENTIEEVKTLHSILCNAHMYLDLQVDQAAPKRQKRGQ